MTISTTDTRVDYLGNGATTIFPVPFAFFASNELQVIERDIPTGGETTLVLGVGYTVAGGNGGSGTVTATTAPATDKQWTIRRSTSPVQPFDFSPNDSSPSQSVETGFDRLTLVVQELATLVSAALRVSATDPGSGLVLPSSVARAGRLLGFDTNGAPVPVSAALGPAIVTPFGETLINAANAATARTVLGAGATGAALFLAATAAIARAALDLDPLQTGEDNLLINPNPTINQRGYVSGSAAILADTYTLDRWRVVTSGQAISWTDSAGVRTVTAPTGGVEQVIEGAAILADTYTLSWTGTATATVNGAAVANGGQVVLPGGGNATVRFSNGTFSLPKLARGGYATPFVLRHPQVELARCQRYGVALSVGLTGAASAVVQHAVPLRLPVTMRATPTVSTPVNAGGTVNISAFVATPRNADIITVGGTPSATGNFVVDFTAFASAEL